MVKYKGHMFWARLTYIYTEDEKVAAELGMKPYSKQCPHIFKGELPYDEREELYQVTRFITYQGRRFKVATYGFETDTYLLLSFDMSLVDTMGFEWEDPGMCGKIVSVSETSDPVDEITHIP